jgi:hypothetical protein
VTNYDEDYKARAARRARVRAGTPGRAIEESDQPAGAARVTDHEKDLIDPIDYRLSLKEYKAAEQAVDLIVPVERNKTPRWFGSLWGRATSNNSRPSVREVCRMDVEVALGEIGFALYIANFSRWGKTKADKRKASQIARALQHVSNLVREFNNMKGDFPLKAFPFAELTKWKQVFDKMAELSSKKNTQLNALKKRLAVAEAYQLLKKYGPARHRRGHDLPSITATKGGKFCRLAALLYGKPKTDLTNQCKAYIRVRTSSAAEYIEQRRVVWKRFKERRLGEKLGTK